MGKLWQLLEDWRDGLEYPPSWRRVARDLDVSQSTFDTWKSPKKLPTRENLEAIAVLTRTPYRVVLDAAIEDTRYAIPPSQDQAATGTDATVHPLSTKGRHRPGPDTSRAVARELDERE